MRIEDRRHLPGRVLFSILNAQSEIRTAPLDSGLWSLDSEFYFRWTLDVGHWTFFYQSGREKPRLLRQDAEGQSHKRKLRIENLKLRIKCPCLSAFNFSILNAQSEIRTAPLDSGLWSLDCLLPRWTLDVGRRFSTSNVQRKTLNSDYEQTTPDHPVFGRVRRGPCFLPHGPREHHPGDAA